MEMEFTDRDFNKNRQLNDIGYCTFGEAAFTFKNSKEFTNYIARQKRLNSCILWPDIKAIH